LSYRYGKRMQMIAGLHYNFSLPEPAWPLPGLATPTEGYFALIRNFRRHTWLLYVLFGASPAVCSCFVAGRDHALREFAPGTLHLPHATSLRMGRLGYLSAAQDSLNVSCNSLESYSDSLQDALTRPYPPYVAIGLRDGKEYKQLATSLLQIENEYYTPIRPKRVIRSGERPLHALRERGVQYVEVRAMDLDPFEPVGISESTMRFLDVFLLHCLLSDSPEDNDREIAAMRENNQLAAARGRESGLQLERAGRRVDARQWGGQVLAECWPIAAALDDAIGGTAHRDALSSASAGLARPDTLPSAKVLAAMREDHGGSYSRFALAQSRRHRESLLAGPLPAEFEKSFERLAVESLAKQRTAEAGDHLSFDAYLERYLSPELLQV
jgi:glutamate--cysteine ligase